MQKTFFEVRFVPGDQKEVTTFFFCLINSITLMTDPDSVAGTKIRIVGQRDYRLHHARVMTSTGPPRRDALFAANVNRPVSAVQDCVHSYTIRMYIRKCY